MFFHSHKALLRCCLSVFPPTGIFKTMLQLIFVLVLSLESVAAFSARNLAPQTKFRAPRLVENIFAPRETEAGSNDGASSSSSIPFVIEQIETPFNPRIFEEIAEMCIEVFFNAEDGPTTPWKELQLYYLRNVQTSDLKFRRISGERPNSMFVARRVLKMQDRTVHRWTPLLIEQEGVFGVDVMEDDYVSGEVLGFCEVTKRPYGLGRLPSEGKGRGSTTRKYASHNPTRPILTNLAVSPEARKAGIGSALLDRCEQSVIADLGASEVVLEVEYDNPRAKRFYEKRGYNVVFEDPACRRFDTSGLLLKQKKCTKICMRKDLARQRAMFGYDLAKSTAKSVIPSWMSGSGSREAFMSGIFGAFKERVLR